MEEGLKEKTGKPLEYWVEILKQTKLEKHMQMVKFLKENHGFTHGFANMVALKAREAGADDFSTEGLILNQYKGKEHLRPIGEKIIELAKSFGNDVEVAPKKANVSLRRKKQFALVQPPTKTRIDLGLKFKDKPFEGRLEKSGPFGTMCSHGVQITSIDQVDDELINLLKLAYLEA